MPTEQPLTHFLCCFPFPEEFCTFLLGKGIPDHIVSLPQEVLNSPFGQLLSPILTQLEQQLGNMGANTNTNNTNTKSHPPPRNSNKAEDSGKKADEGEERPTPAQTKNKQEEDRNADSNSSSRNAEPPRQRSAKEEFERQVKIEFQKIMAAGLHTAQEAAVLALSLVRECMEGKMSK
jgi:hypothetical protein